MFHEFHVSLMQIVEIVLYVLYDGMGFPQLPSVSRCNGFDEFKSHSTSAYYKNTININQPVSQWDKHAHWTLFSSKFVNSRVNQFNGAVNCISILRFKVRLHPYHTGITANGDDNSDSEWFAKSGLRVTKNKIIQPLRKVNGDLLLLNCLYSIISGLVLNLLCSLVFYDYNDTPKSFVDRIWTRSAWLGCISSDITTSQGSKRTHMNCGSQTIIIFKNHTRTWFIQNQNFNPTWKPNRQTKQNLLPYRCSFKCGNRQAEELYTAPQKPLSAQPRLSLRLRALLSTNNNGTPPPPTTAHISRVD